MNTLGVYLPFVPPEFLEHWEENRGKLQQMDWKVVDSKELSRSFIFFQMEILDQGKGKSKVEKPMENSIWLGNLIPAKRNSRPSSADSFSGTIIRGYGTTNDLDQTGTRDEATFIGNPLEWGNRGDRIQL
ncbi:hypothetical protein AVEN_101483-1 [Araneus ventricosus]|uniref:Uncharacterized protein n=1 Tax=Araneus ventricosus TaxID=182803 RepID=A0A4Y2WTQ4_ARAVE|nr:hypothetical protein AVEN_101483-1 [Araneus ventricosus]